MTHWALKKKNKEVNTIKNLRLVKYEVTVNVILKKQPVLYPEVATRHANRHSLKLDNWDSFPYFPKVISEIANMFQGNTKISHASVVTC